MGQALVKETRRDFSSLMDRLLDSFNALNYEHWEDLDLIRSAVEEAREVKDSQDYTPEQRKAVATIFENTLPLYEAVNKRYETDSEFRKMVGILRQYKSHMGALQQVINDIDKSVAYAKGTYSSVVSNASLFLFQEGQYLPKGKRFTFSQKLELARRKLP